MNKLFRTVLMAGLAFGLLLSQSKVASAQSINERAVLVYKVSSIDAVLDTVGYSIRSAGFGEMVPFITLSAGAFLDGFDTSKPIGGYVTLDDGGPQSVTFVPVSDIEDVVAMLESNGVEIEEDGDDYIVVAPTGDEIIIRTKGKWAFISDNEEALSSLPKDPSKLVAGISDDYVIGVKAYVQKVPAEMRDWAIEMMEEAFEQANAGISGGAAELQQKLNQNSLDQLGTIIQETDEIFLGFSADKKNKRFYMDFSITGKQGSELAKNLAAGKGSKTEFASLLKNKDAAVTFNASSKISGSDAENAANTLKILKDEIGNLLGEDDNLSDDDVELYSEFIEDVVGALEATLKTGKVDMGGAVLIDDDGLNLIAGTHLADAKSVEAGIKKLVAERGDELPPQIEIDLDASTYKGVTFHKVTGPVDDEEAQQILGDNPELIIGVGKSKVFIGFGESPEDDLKEAIDGLKSSTEKPPTQFNINIAPILRLAGKANDQDMLLEMADKLDSKGNPLIKISGDYIENGQRTRMEIEDGILSLIEIGASGFGGGGGFGSDF